MDAARPWNVVGALLRDAGEYVLGRLHPARQSEHDEEAAAEGTGRHAEGGILHARRLSLHLTHALCLWSMVNRLHGSCLVVMGHACRRRLAHAAAHGLAAVPQVVREAAAAPAAHGAGAGQQGFPWAPETL